MIEGLLANNRRWITEKNAENPSFFDTLAAGQAPKILWIGCADSRAPAEQLLGLQAGDLFVHRNVANRVDPQDPNCLSVIQYAIEVLKVEHIIICGHHKCGGVRAAYDRTPLHDPIATWIAPITALAETHTTELNAIADIDDRCDRLAELHALQQVQILQSLPFLKTARDRHQPLQLHALNYRIRSGKIVVLENS